MNADQNALASVTIGGLFSDSFLLLFFKSKCHQVKFVACDQHFFKNKEIEEKIEYIKLYDK